jgi:DNA-binding NtrC family response regulator
MENSNAETITHPKEHRAEIAHAMGCMPDLAPISCASRRRLARWLVGSSIRDIERDLVLETLANTHGNRTTSARLLGVSVRTLRNKITEYSAEGVDVPRHERGSLGHQRT